MSEQSITIKVQTPVLSGLPVVPLQVCGSAADVERITGVKKSQLVRLVRAGMVRCKLIGSTQQADRLYSVLDVIEWLHGPDVFPCEGAAAEAAREGRSA